MVYGLFLTENSEGGPRCEIFINQREEKKNLHEFIERFELG